YAGNLNAAADAYAAALQTDPDREGVALALAENLKILGRYNEAAKAYEHHVRANREDGLAWKELGLAMMKIGETEKAKKSLRKARELLPDDAGIALIRADILLNARDFDEACTAYEETLELIPDSVPAMRGHALALAGAGRNKEASAEFEKYLDKEEDDNDMRIAYGAVCEKLGEFELAIGHYAAILEEKDDLNLWLRLLGILKMMGRYEDCAEGCEDLIGKKPECAEAYRILAEVKYRLGEFKKSAESYEKALELEPSNKAGRLTYAETLLKAGRYKEALQNFGIALDGSSGEGDCESYYLCAVAQMHMGGYEKAIKFLGKALADNDEIPGALLMRANAYERLGQYEDALEGYENAIRASNRDPALWNARGMLLLNLGRFNDAGKSFERAIEYGAEDTACWYGKGVALDEIGKFDAAIEAYDHVLSEHPTDTAILYRKGTCLTKLGRYQEAAECFNKANKREKKEKEREKEEKDIEDDEENYLE
ncbi:MAG: tetratricopeptide repeat protein, partial [Methanomicrobium sp.]|nr:tetratricopeptide repeat protein [Methanomicrobium sp.]